MPHASEPSSAIKLAVHGIELETWQRGVGPPIVLLHGFEPIDPMSGFCSRLAQHARIIAPSLPGFGASPRPSGFETIYDLVNLCSALLDTLPTEKLTIIGCSFGGWLAAELAVRSCAKIARLILVDPVGIKISDRETPDILDIFNTHPDEVRRRSWFDVANAPDYDAMTDTQLIIRHRNWESLSLYAWHPYLHNPRLAYWLPRISTPTLVIWGADDRIVSPAYGRAFAGLIPGACFSEIGQAGHRPEVEQPDIFVDRVLEFLNS